MHEHYDNLPTAHVTWQAGAAIMLKICIPQIFFEFQSLSGCFGSYIPTFLSVSSVKLQYKVHGFSDPNLPTIPYRIIIALTSCLTSSAVDIVLLCGAKINKSDIVSNQNKSKQNILRFCCTLIKISL
jgi:hypothetical protein